MNAEVRSILVGTVGLWFAAGIAIFLAISRRPNSAIPGAARHAAAMLLATAAAQAAHFGEEWQTKFFDAFPARLGLAPWPADFFWWFNMTWLAVWIISVAGVRCDLRIAYFPAWFLALAGILNGIAHPLLALSIRGYFPGLWTSPLIGVCGALLWWRLRRATEPIESRTNYPASSQ